MSPPTSAKLLPQYLRSHIAIVCEAWLGNLQVVEAERKVLRCAMVTIIGVRRRLWRGKRGFEPRELEIMLMLIDINLTPLLGWCEQRWKVWWRSRSEAGGEAEQGGVRLPCLCWRQIRHWVLEAGLWHHPSGVSKRTFISKLRLNLLEHM